MRPRTNDRQVSLERKVMLPIGDTADASYGQSLDFHELLIILYSYGWLAHTVLRTVSYWIPLEVERTAR